MVMTERVEALLAQLHQAVVDEYQLTEAFDAVLPWHGDRRQLEDMQELVEAFDTKLGGSDATDVVMTMLIAWLVRKGRIEVGLTGVGGEDSPPIVVPPDSDEEFVDGGVYVGGVYFRVRRE